MPQVHPSAAARGPYCTGAFTPSGAGPQVTVPQPHRLPIIWCSVISAFTGGISVTCRRIGRGSARLGQVLPAAGAAGWPVPDHVIGMIGSCIVAPGCPFGRPGLRPAFPRSDFGAGLPSPSDDGGFEEFFEFCRTWAARSATCA